MAKIKYDVKGVEPTGDKPEQPKPGMYLAEIVEVNEKDSKSGNGAMLEVIFQIKSDSKGKKKGIPGIGAKTWHYVMLEHEPSAFRLLEFLEAIGKVKGSKGKAGTLDTDALVGLVLQVQLKSDKDLDGDYRPRVGKVLAADAAGSDDEDEPDEPDEDDPDEEEDDEESEDDDDEEGSEDDDEEAVDLDELDRSELKAFIKDQELDISVKKSMSDDDIREAIAEALGESEDEDEEDDEDEDEDDGDDGLDALDRVALKKLLKENDLPNAKKSEDDDALRARLREAEVSVESGDDEEDDDESPDYDSWDSKQLNAELKERGLPVKGKMADKVKALKADDKDDKDPF